MGGWVSGSWGWAEAQDTPANVALAHTGSSWQHHGRWRRQIEGDAAGVGHSRSRRLPGIDRCAECHTCAAAVASVAHYVSGLAASLPALSSFSGRLFSLSLQMNCSNQASFTTLQAFLLSLLEWVYFALFGLFWQTRSIIGIYYTCFPKKFWHCVNC